MPDTPCLSQSGSSLASQPVHPALPALNLILTASQQSPARPPTSCAAPCPWLQQPHPFPTLPLVTLQTWLIPRSSNGVSPTLGLSSPRLPRFFPASFLPQPSCLHLPSLCINVTSPSALLWPLLSKEVTFFFSLPPPPRVCVTGDKPIPSPSYDLRQGLG